MKWCTHCILPDTRPNTTLDASGRCNAATMAEKDAIDWVARAAQFRELVTEAASRRAPYDCVIPVSGGKDSTWQVTTCLERGLHPLAVTWRPPGRTLIGQRNLDNLRGLGVDHIDFSINPEVERRFARAAFERQGQPALPMHMALYAIPFTIAMRFGIPLVVYGENSAFEYGGEKALREGDQVTEAFLHRFGVTGGTTALDWVGPTLSARELAPYVVPSAAALAARGVRPLFLGSYFKWDPKATSEVAIAHGFARSEQGPRVGFWDSADLDDEFISVHHWLKWHKFGMTRLIDNLALEIRHGRMDRDEAVEIVRRRGDCTPKADIRAFCEWIGLPEADFYRRADGFRNRDIWVRRGGVWMIEGFLVPDWEWT